MVFASALMKCPTSSSVTSFPPGASSARQPSGKPQPSSDGADARVASLTTDDSYSVAEATPVPSEANRAASVS